MMYTVTLPVCLLAPKATLTVDDVVVTHLRWRPTAMLHVFTSSQTRLTYNFVKQHFFQTPGTRGLYHVGYIVVAFERFYFSQITLYCEFFNVPVSLLYRFAFKSSLQSSNLTSFCSARNVLLVMRRLSGFHQHLIQFVFRWIFMHMEAWCIISLSPRDATQSAVLLRQIVRLSVRLSMTLRYR